MPVKLPFEAKLLKTELDDFNIEDAKPLELQEYYETLADHMKFLVSKVAISEHMLPKYKKRVEEIRKLMESVTSKLREE